MTEYIYKAKIEHNKKTIESLFRTQYYAYEKTRILIRFIVGIALIIISVGVTLPIWLRGVLLLIGTWIVSSPDFPAQVKTDKVIQARKGNFPNITYEFYGDRIKLYDNNSYNKNILYKELTRIIHDKKYFYLFLDKNSACMIDKESLLNQDSEKFMQFIENKTGITWHVQKSIFSINIKDILNISGILREKAYVIFILIAFVKSNKIIKI